MNQPNENFKRIVQIVIDLHSNGGVNIHGPLHDKILCLGLLEIAKDLVKSYKPDGSQIVKPLLVIPSDVIGKG